jgi:hypothetical protein
MFRLIKPNGLGIVDVVNDYPWTLSPKESRRDAPRAYLKEYQQNGGQLIAAIIYYGRVLNKAINDGVEGLGNTLLGATDASEVYKYKYIAEPTGWEYSLPFFSTHHTNRSSGFGYEDGQNPFSSLISLGHSILGFDSHGGGIASLARKATGFSTGLETAKAAINTVLPGKISFESPKNWDNTAEESINIQFHLFNTGSANDVVKNREFVNTLRHNNTPSRRNFAIVDPPVIYELYIADIINMPACYISSLDITNMGNTRIMDLGGRTRTIPEAYGINITLNSLLMPTRNILEALNAGRSVEAISNAGDLLSLATDFVSGFAGNATPQQTARINNIRIRGN